MPGCYSSLTWDCVIEIQACLPVKSLLRFRCVSHSWNALITTNNPFIAKHLARSTQSRNQCFLLNCGLLRDETSVIPMVSCHDSIGDQILNLGLPVGNLLGFEGALDSLRFVGSSNGLVCLTKPYDGHGSINYVWNPATRDFRALPVSPFHISERRFSTVAHGFGSNSACNDYKLIRMVSHSDGYTTTCKFLLDVYTLSNDSWEKIGGDLQYCINPAFRPVLFNGSFHCRGAENGKRFIVSLDIRNDMLRKLPPVASCELDDSWKLDVLNESLATINLNPEKVEDGYMDIWVMEDYGVEGHWTKNYRIGPFKSPFVAVGMWKKSELLMLVELPDRESNRIFSYILEKGEEVDIPPLDGGDFLSGIHRYVESIANV